VIHPKKLAMNVRKKMAERSLGLLPPETRIRHIFAGQTGPCPWWSLLTWVVVLWQRPRIVAVTDSHIHVLATPWLMPTRPKRLIATLPRDGHIGPVSGLLWARVQIGDERIWVRQRFHKDITAADAELVAAVVSPAPAAVMARPGRGGL